MCLFLLLFPCYMAYKISHFFHMDFWLLILVSSCMLTSLQVLGTLFIYTLFVIELFQDSRVEMMDEIIYCVNAVSRVLEFLVALCVVAYGSWESIFGEWSWMGVSVIIVHSYFNVWLRAQSGWKSFLLRREAVKKINALPKATMLQLRAHNDVCSICFQDMTVSVITPCNHFFHGDCLRKWFYVQDTCPMCFQQVKPDVLSSSDRESEADSENGEDDFEHLISEAEEDTDSTEVKVTKIGVNECGEECRNEISTNEDVQMESELMGTHKRVQAVDAEVGEKNKGVENTQEKLDEELVWGEVEGLHDTTVTWD
ncbi:RING finger 145-like [Pelobates cultripes]|uniref:RING finger protein 145 n=1 Tax=Pelobates cultripes TaxID=61616 RepID=A0AAD1SFE8_PELCU|nr:RING finger 145-like [Pelobates cultripes]